MDRHAFSPVIRVMQNSDRRGRFTSSWIFILHNETIVSVHIGGYHYENMSVQYAAISKNWNNDNF